MPDEILTPEHILDVTEDVLRRFGPAKATVVDVARALGVSHGSVYRHFASKAALRDAVTARWLERVSEPLEQIVTEDAPALERLRRWLDLLIATKRKRALDDSELFATYMELAADSREVVQDHVDHLVDQATRIITDGVQRGEWKIDNPAKVAQAVFHATTRFHKPAHVAEWTNSAIDAEFEGVWELIKTALNAYKA